MWWSRQSCQHRAIIQCDRRSPQGRVCLLPKFTGQERRLEGSTHKLGPELEQSVSMLWATSNSPSQMTLNNNELNVSLNWKCRSRVGISIGYSDHSCSIFVWFPLTGLRVDSLSGWLPLCGNSRCHIHTPNIRKKKGVSLIDCLLRMKKFLFQKPPSSCAPGIWLGSQAYFWDNRCAQVNAISNLAKA